MSHKSLLFAVAIAGSVSAVALAQAPKATSSSMTTNAASTKASGGKTDAAAKAGAATDTSIDRWNGKPWVAPGTPGSVINGELFHAQVLLDAAAFSPGPIDGKKGQSFTAAVKGFQMAHGGKPTGMLDNDTRRALMQIGRQSTVMVKLGQDDVRSQYINPLPKDPALQEKLPFLGYRNALEKIAERYHTTPDTVIALNGPTAKIGLGQTLRLPNVIPTSRDYKGSPQKGAMLMNLLNVDARQPQGDYVVVDKSDGVLRVYKGTPPAGPLSVDKGKDSKTAKPAKADASANSLPTDAGTGQLVAQFPVTMGSTHDPLPIGTWKVTTYAYLPPFHYQPNLFWDAKDTATEHMLPPGPNGPVGVAWLDLTKEHYGIHGTPSPETIGRAESHGCIRMSNWDVIRLSRIMKPGFKAIFQA